MGLDVDVAIVNGEKRAINSLSGHKAPPGRLVVIAGANGNSLVDYLLAWMGQNGFSKMRNQRVSSKKCVAVLLQEFHRTTSLAPHDQLRVSAPYGRQTHNNFQTARRKVLHLMVAIIVLDKKAESSLL